MQYYYDDKRHLVCVPYSKPNLHAMAQDLGIKRGWYNKTHYDIPKSMLGEVSKRATKVSSHIVKLIIQEKW